MFTGGVKIIGNSYPGIKVLLIISILLLAYAAW